MATDLSGFRCPHCCKTGTVAHGKTKGKGWCTCGVIVDIPVAPNVTRRDIGIGVATTLIAGNLQNGLDVLSKAVAGPESKEIRGTANITQASNTVQSVGRASAKVTVKGYGKALGRRG